MSEKEHISEQGRCYGASKEWTTWEKHAFRVAFIFFSLFSIPLDVGFYRFIWNIDYAPITYRELNSIVAFYNPQFINHFSEGGFFGLQSYANIPFILLVSLIGAAIWGSLDKQRKEYNVLYYWVRVLARYRVAYAAIAWGYKKLFIMQMPVQSIGAWHTDFIDFFAKRLYWEALSIVPTYEFYLGFAEFIGGFLLLFRKTTGIGAAITLVVFGNIAISNHAYDIGEQVPSACMAMLSLFILWYDLPGIWRLIVKQANAKIVYFYPVFHKAWQRYARLIIKYSFNFIFVILFFIFEVYAYTHNDFYKIPNTPGLKDAAGFYEVTAFKLNNEVIPYSPHDSVRWHDVTFEKWSSISFKLANRTQDIEMFAAGSYPRRWEVYDSKWRFDWRGDIRRYPDKRREYDPENRDLNIRWELSGIGGRFWYHYKADTTNKILYLQNKNRTDVDQKQVLHYNRPHKNRIVLWGTNEFNDSIHVVLDRADKKYPLLEGRK